MTDDRPLPPAPALPSSAAAILDPEVVTISEARVGIARIMGRRGAGLEAAVRAAVGVAPPAGPGVTRAGDVSLIGVGRQTWLAVKDGATHAWADSLATRLAGRASVVDQSSGYAVLRLAGPGARTLLQRGVFIDLHPRAFGPGSAAITYLSHLDAIIWQADAATEFHVAVFRSYIGSFVDWIRSAAAAGDLTG